ncbi:MAG: AAA family ATPase, partial [Bacteroidota bacterium]|nr:AAA family ATPase [Bacteroidota bacterium]
MIQEFSFGNFKSFKDINSLNMTAAKIDDLNNKGITNDNKPLLKSKAIYGANASGKSNMVKALVAFLRIINSSVKNNKIINLIENYRLSTETENQPTFFQLIFQFDDIIYRYGFEATNEKITSE